MGTWKALTCMHSSPSVSIVALRCAAAMCMLLQAAKHHGSYSCRAGVCGRSRKAATVGTLRAKAKALEGHRGTSSTSRTGVDDG